MKLARYVGSGQVAIRDEAEPEPKSGGLLIQIEACGLCSGELMDWYMEQKVPHVLGHEVSGKVIWSDDPSFPVGSRVAPHHHAPCGECDWCRSGRQVHCPTWKATKLEPGGMAERCFVPKENLLDTHCADDLRPVEAALMEPLACVMKSISRGRLESFESVAVVGLGVMGLMHLAALGDVAWGIDTNPKRTEWAEKQGFRCDLERKADAVVVCPGTPEAFNRALEIVNPGGTVLMFSPFEPGKPADVDWSRIYFKDLSVIASYSCGPLETQAALAALRRGVLRAEMVVSDFIPLESLPEAYLAMKNGDILKAMVVFD